MKKMSINNSKRNSIHKATLKHQTLTGVVAVATSLLLAGCFGLDEVGEDQTTTTQNEQVPVTTTNNQLSTDYYRALIEDGKYKTSASRGASLSLNSAYNIKNFENGLLELSKSVFPTDQYYFQEGQLLDSKTVNEWISRQSDDNPNGLNPKDNGEKDASKRAPLYLDQILEQNYVVKHDNVYELSGISIGLAMNSVDSYTVDGKEVKQSIDDGAMEEQAKEMAGTILQRLRENNDLKDVPITIGVFKESEPDDIAGGVYILSATSTEGSLISDWTKINDKIVVFPLSSGDPTQDSTQFDNFRSEVESFFPNLSGVTGRAFYKNDKMDKLQIDIMTQFYGESEIIAFAQHVTDVANKYLQFDAPVQIQINSINGQEALLIQDQKEQSFTYYIYQ